MKLNNSAIIYEGKSLLDNQPVVAIATGFSMSNNSKLGSNVVQVWIMRSDIKPIEAAKTGKDYSVCGNCPLRRQTCYVNLGFAPAQIYRSYRKGSYEPISEKYFKRLREYKKILRLTAYGDVSAIPRSAIQPLIDNAIATIGYTHQWRVRQEYKGLLMASCETPQQAIAAQAMGWKTFRIKNQSDPLLTHEQHCTNQQNKAVQCEDCLLCDGKQTAIAVDIHGLKWKKDNYQQLIANHQ